MTRHTRKQNKANHDDGLTQRNEDKLNQEEDFPTMTNQERPIREQRLSRNYEDFILNLGQSSNMFSPRYEAMECINFPRLKPKSLTKPASNKKHNVEPSTFEEPA